MANPPRPENHLRRFNQFLAGIDLAACRARFAHIKLVELNLPRNIQAIPFLYREYWERRDAFPLFDEFFETYRTELRRELLDFRKRTMFSRETFNLGLPARIYRTWASLLTQIQGGYAAESLYGRGNVEMSADLDYRGVDIRVRENANAEWRNIQIKKETMSREVRAPWPTQRRGVDIVVVTYEVPGCGPLTKTGKPSVPFGRWREKWAGRLERLDNGFIIFRPEMFAMENLGAQTAPVGD